MAFLDNKGLGHLWQHIIAKLGTKADISHTHNDIYYTESEIDEKLVGKADISHNHDSVYETKVDATTKLDQAKSYADTASTNAANIVKNDLLNGAGGAYDTLKELGDLIDENTDAIDALEIIAVGKADAEHTHDDRYYTEDEVDALIGNLSENVYSKADHDWVQIYDSGEITSSVNAFANIDISGFKNLRVVVKCVNDGTNTTSKNGSVTFTATNGTTYQFPCWTTMFTNADYTSGCMATFEINDGWLVCSNASRMLKTSNFLGTEGGTVDNLSATGSGIMKCTNELSTIMVSALDQDTNYYFLAGSRVMVWGRNA